MRRLAREIGAVDLIDALHEAADALDRIFSDLAAAAELKVAELRQKEAHAKAPPAPKLAYN